jgi:hypothetical protein
MATENTGGAQTATLDTVHTLATISTAGIFVCGVDLSNLANGDVVELTVKTKLRTGSTSAVAYKATFAHEQGQPNQYSVPVVSPFELIFTLEQSDGTGRSFDWTVYEA